jgi:hypothetical protein
LNRQGARFRSEPDQVRFVRSPVAGTMEPVKPQFGQVVVIRRITRNQIGSPILLMA